MSGAAFRRNVDVWVQDNLTAEARSALLARTARQKLAELQAQGRAPRHFTRYVDGMEGAPEDSVRPNGVILYRFRFLANAAAFALSYLQARSPVRSGAFRAGFYLGVGGDRDGDGGRFLRAADFVPAAVTGDVQAIVIGNVEPYNRQVDVQMAGQRRMRFTVPANMYADAASAVRARFPGVSARAVYSRSFPGQYVLRTGPRAGKPVHSPALVISVAE